MPPKNAGTITRHTTDMQSPKTKSKVGFRILYYDFGPWTLDFYALPILVRDHHLIQCAMASAWKATADMASNLPGGTLS
jgi:hypothetical protein